MHGVVVGLIYGQVNCLLLTVPDVSLHSLFVHPSLFDGVESCPHSCRVDTHQHLSPFSALV